MFESNACWRQMRKSFDYDDLDLFFAYEKGTRLLFDEAALCTPPASCSLQPPKAEKQMPFKWRSSHLLA